jgi:hypothetical protein
LEGLADIRLAQRASGVKRQEPVQFFTREWLLGRVKIDPNDGAALGCGILSRCRYDAEQQRQDHQHRRTHLIQ